MLPAAICVGVTWFTGRVFYGESGGRVTFLCIHHSASLGGKIVANLSQGFEKFIITIEPLGDFVEKFVTTFDVVGSALRRVLADMIKELLSHSDGALIIGRGQVEVPRNV